MRAKKITILNKLSESDSVSHREEWFKTIIENVSFSVTRVQNVDGNNVSIGQTYTILIPFSEQYVPYHEWRELEKKENFYTMSQGDCVVFTDVVESVTNSDGFEAVRRKYSHCSCEVRSIEEVERTNGATIQLRLKGV